MFKSFKYFFLLLFYVSNTYCQADEINNNPISTYNWGRGLNIEPANLNLGGYINISFESETDRVALDDLSLFVSWSPHAQLHFFAELEMENLISSQGVADFSESFSLERLYVDFQITPSLSARFGQFLTPVGLWNTTHAAPLVWTTSRPIATKSDIFPSRTNGLLLSKQFIFYDHDLDIAVYFDHSDHLNPRNLNFISQRNHKDQEAAFKYALGTHIYYETTESLKSGLSYLAFKKQTHKNLATNHLIGLDLLWQDKGYETQIEMSYRTAPDQQGSEFSGYAQGVIPLGHQLFAIARYEWIAGTHQQDSKNIKSTTHIGVPALAWRPYPPLIIKAEYRFGNNKKLISNHFFTSISMLF